MRSATRARTLVFGVGDPHARVMFIGEAPGRNEDLKGEPFVGAAGKLLDELLGEAGLRARRGLHRQRAEVPPSGQPRPAARGDRDVHAVPREQIRLIEPQVLVTLGNFATQFVLKTDTGITRLHGSPQRAGRFVVFPIFHPAAALYDRTKQDALREDFRSWARFWSRSHERRGDPDESGDCRRRTQRAAGATSDAGRVAPPPTHGAQQGTLF